MAHLERGYLAALDEGRKSLEEGGIPVGSAIVDEDGNIIGRGHNHRVQTQSIILHVCLLVHTPTLDETEISLPKGRDSSL